MAMKLIVLCCLFAVALGFTLPEDRYDGANDLPIPLEQPSLDNGEVLIRNARSPQRRIDAGMEHHSRYGTSANVNYNHPLGNNFEAYGGVSRNFKYNDNSGHVGLRYRF